MKFPPDKPCPTCGYTIYGLEKLHNRIAQLNLLVRNVAILNEQIADKIRKYEDAQS
jgi:hypothetical protein